MSTSLNKDLHSVYVDGEMPENFLPQYEGLIASDKEASSDLDKVKALHCLMQEDSASKTVDQAFMDESFQRLQTKMRYAKNVSLSTQEKARVFPFAKYAASFGAAAAVFALVFIPIHNRSLNQAKETAIAAISIMKEKSIQPIAKKDVIVDGSLNKVTLSSLAVNSSKEKNASSSLNKGSNAIAKAEDSSSNSSLPGQYEQKTVSATSLASFGATISREERFGNMLPSVDPFVPDFSSSSITISVPNFQEIGNNLKIMNSNDER